MWRKRSASPLHALHMGFGIGSFIVPLIANPFMADRVPMALPNSTNFTDANYSNFTTTPPEAGGENDMDKYVLVNSRIEYAYAITASIPFVVACVFYYYQCDGKSRNIYRSNPDEGKSEKTKSLKEIINPTSCTGGGCLSGTLLFLLLFFFFFNIEGLERTAGKFIRVYAIDQLKFSKDDGTYINTVFWALFSVGRFSGFIAANWVPIRILLVIEVFVQLIFAGLLNIFADDSKLMLWVFSTPLGFFLGPLFPTGVGWANHHVEMTGFAITFLLCGAALGGVSYTWIIGYLYDTYGPISFLFQILTGCVILSLITILLSILSKIKGTRYDNKNVTSENSAEKNASETKF